MQIRKTTISYTLLILGIVFSVLSVKTQSLCDGTSLFRVLHFTKTTGFDHNTRDVSAEMFMRIGESRGFTITDTDDAGIFDQVDSLMQFAVIVFSNTSGNTLFNAQQQQNIETYINGGGSYIGIHAATDTYRTGWPFYNALVGAIVQTGPNHTSQNHVNFMDHQETHPILSGIPNPWAKEEEYYYWDLNGGMIDTIAISELLNVRQTGNESYDRTRPVTWYQTFDNKARSFYTALGHKRINYETPGNTFSLLIENAVCWAAIDQSLDVSNAPEPTLHYFPNPVSDQLHLVGINGSVNLSIYDMRGNLWLRKFHKTNQINLEFLPPGIYVLNIQTHDQKPIVFKIVKD